MVLREVPCAEQRGGAGRDDAHRSPLDGREVELRTVEPRRPVPEMPSEDSEQSGLLPHPDDVRLGQDGVRTCHGALEVDGTPHQGVQRLGPPERQAPHPPREGRREGLLEGMVEMTDLPLNQVIQGHVLDVLRQLPDESIDCVVTSPPYWGLRDYKSEPVDWGDWKGQLGLEPDFHLYVKHIVGVFHEVRRVLKGTGSVYVNLGDTYSGSGKGYWPGHEDSSKEVYHFENKPESKSDLPAKCLTGIPERIMLAMIDDGWILRNKVIWYKRNHMPSSVKDRFSSSWEVVYFFVKSQRYWFDLDAVRVPHSGGAAARFKVAQYDEKEMMHRVKPDGRFEKDHLSRPPEPEVDPARAFHPGGKNPGDIIEQKYEDSPLRPPSFARKRHSGYLGEDGESLVNPSGKNPSDFWELTTQPFPEAHFATFPEKLVERPIKASCPPNGVVLDPFFGSGTVGVVALKLARSFIGIELNPAYVEMAKRRLQPLLSQEKLV